MTDDKKSSKVKSVAKILLAYFHFVEEDKILKKLSFGKVVSLGSNLPSTISEAIVLSCDHSPDVYQFPALFNHLGLKVGGYSTFPLTCVAPDISAKDAVKKEQMTRKLKIVASQSNLKRVFVIVCASCASANNRLVSQTKEISKSALRIRRDELCEAVRGLREKISFNDEVEFQLFLIESRGDNYFLHHLDGQVPKPRRNRVKAARA